MDNLSKAKKGSSSDSFLKPGLYIVSTPIGNIEDITIRALKTLAKVDIIACEDTRHTKKLLNLHSIKYNLLISYNDHNAKSKIPFLIKKLKEQTSVALVSDAGTPLISDPGYKLVKEVKLNKINLYTVPGPSALIAALSISGVTTDKFTFIGFLPKKKNIRTTILKELACLDQSIIIYERASRLLDLLHEIKNIFENRSFVVAREITKLYEETLSGNFSEMSLFIKKHNITKGEITLLINSIENKTDSKIITDEFIKSQLKDNKPSKVASMIAKDTQSNRKNIYDRCINLSKKTER